MATSFFNGKITGFQHPVFTEASDEYDKLTATGETPHQLLCAILMGQHKVTQNGEDLWIHGKEIWIRIEPDGTLEIGEPAA